MTYAELVAHVAENAETTQKDATRVARVLFVAIARAAKRGERVVIPGFGVFIAKAHRARRLRNVADGELMRIPGEQRLKFRASKHQRRKR